METHETKSNVEGTETLTPAHWVKAQTLQYFWKALSRELDAGRTYVDCVRQLQGFFKAGNGAPTGRQLREVVTRMVQTKQVPADFRTAWDRRRGRERTIAPGAQNALIDEPVVDEPSELNAGTADNSAESGPSTVVAIERTDVINGWPLAVVERRSVPLIEDEELGRRLGYADPRMVRKLVRRIFKDSELLSTVSQRGGRPATVYLLTERQALKVAMRSETPSAEVIQDEILAVYEAWLNERRTAPTAGTVSLDVARLEAFLEKRDAAFTSIVTSALELAKAAKAEASEAMRERDSMDARIVALEERARVSSKTTSKRARVFKSRLPAAPLGWAAHRAVAAEHGLPSAGPTGRVVEMICRAMGLAGDPEIARVAPHGSFNTLTLMLSPQCVLRIERALDAAREAMHDYGYQVSDAKMFEPRREVRPLLSPTRVLAKMVAAARARLGLAAAA